MHSGSCLCGAVTFAVADTLPNPNFCHCRMCRKHSGHYFASTDVPRSALTIVGEENVAWFQSSEKIRRGFCSTCGSSLFWDRADRDWIAIAMGAFDGPTRTKANLHIYVGDKGDYYEIADGLLQYDTVPPRN
ncbi:GFA family protein [Bosea rubneri]|uniref:GFA family protein n=1 Tax=Bosea rubneri TaxID=3075434 RepID=A0ABU3S5Y6_9HYPH|nr:GFA family protein [Bosea sp. ZW T0_25]MDU0340131.1 GFA family protein [Bosea sp. ZW T0_25]